MYQIYEQVTTSGKNANRGTAGGSRIFLIWSPTQTNPANLANITGHSLPSSTFDANIICVCRFIITIALFHLYQVLFDNVLPVPKDCPSLEKGPTTKLDEFLEKFQTAFDHPPLLIAGNLDKIQKNSSFFSWERPLLILECEKLTYDLLHIHRFIYISKKKA